MACRRNRITTRGRDGDSPGQNVHRGTPGGGWLQPTMKLATSCRRQSVVGKSGLIQSSVILPSRVWVILQKELGQRTFVMPPSVSYMAFTFVPQRHCQVKTAN